MNSEIVIKRSIASAIPRPKRGSAESIPGLEPGGSI